MSGELIGPLAELESVEAFSPTGLDLSRVEMDYDRWEAVGRYLGRLRDATAWALGDWLRYGEATFGERYAQGVEATGRSEQTLMNYRSVARAVPPSRRNAALSWSHHRAVVKLDPADQRQWLDRAEEGGWSVAELTDKLRALGSGSPHVGNEELPRHLRIEEAARAVWRSSTLNLTRTEYVAPTGPMQALGRLLDGEQP